ncbi:fungal-specific transcription factor domain-containing protein [Phaeosphaeria sp. MPI-PUGE-AT-0046c]|nr:fungal-specific transcription factor domain-containing protein [Phaeosphaeria sp. MPI-PUGE-AT-0046c]
MAASPATSASGRLDQYLGCEKALIRRHIDAYFDYIYPVPLYSFLHRADFLNRYANGGTTPALLLAVCGASARFLPAATQLARQSKSWIEKAERMLFQSLGRTTLESVQALVLIGLHYNCNNNPNKSFVYVALAARMAYAIKLHKEDSRLSFIDQECRRRLMWCLFVNDRFQAGGVPEYIVLSTASLQIQLPCPEHNFQVDMPVSTSRLEDKSNLNTETSMSTFLLRVFDVRNRILLYAKQLLDTSTSPEQSLPQFQFFEQELKDLLDSLPPELAFSTRAYQLRAFSPERTTFITLHIFFHHCHCELYRLLNPGYREALPNSVIAATSSELVAYAQARCLEHAISIGEIITTTHDLVETDLYMTDMSCFVVLYQASCAILYACHRESPAYTMSPHTARRYFIAFIETLAKLLIHFPRFAIYVNDIRNMLRSIDEPNAPLPPQKASAEVDFRARLVSSEETSDEEAGANKAREQTSAIPHETPHTQTQSPHVQDIGTETMQLIDLSMQAAPPLEGDYGLGPYFGAPAYGFDTAYDPDQGLLWDWADALESGFNL